MNPDRDDTLLDACLDEVLAGRTPPDLTARIVQAHAARRVVDPSVLPAELPGPAAVRFESEVVPPPIVAAANGRPVVELSPSRSVVGRKKSASEWQSVLVAASVIGISLVVGLAWYATRGPQIAENPPRNNQPSVPTVASNNKPAPVPDKVAPQDKPPQQTIVDITPAPRSVPTVDQPLQVATNDKPPMPVTPVEPVVPAPKYREPVSDAEVVSLVNTSLSTAWVASQVTPAPPATDSEWCRRLFVRVLGHIPTVEELKAFSADRSKDKREKLVDRLLTDDNYVEEYSRHWATVWSNVLVGRTGGRGDSLANRDGLEHYLRQSLAHNKPYDKIVSELLTATGSGTPGTPDYNGAANFMLAGLNQDATLATARVSRVFLGHQLQCAQCHNHPTQEWSQQQFWAMNSFLRQMHVEKAGDAVKLVNVDFGGQGKGSTDGEVFYETPTGLLKTAFPAFLDGTAPPPSGKLAEVDRRAELARLVLASDQLPKALVNRVWSHFFGYGFTRPVDDMGPAGSGSHPELLDRLAEEFAAHRYDLKSVIRWVALSDAFGRSSKIPSLRSKDMPEAGEVALFSRYYMRQFGAEEAYNSLVQAARIRKTAANETDVEKARVDWLAQFNRPMGTDDADEESQFSGGIGQSLIMMNGDLMRHAASSEHAGLIASVTASKLKFEEKVGHLFLAALSRDPTRREVEAARTILANSGGQEAIALEDIWWALHNSNEFILDH
jgi:cytoskeletal protein RodZ